MKRYLGVVAAAALLAGTMAVATDALAAGHGGGGFGGGHMGGGFGGGHMGGGFGGGNMGGGLGGGHIGGGFSGGHIGGGLGRGHFGAAGRAFGRGFEGQRFAGMHGHFDHDRGFGRRLRFEPGFYDYGCYGYPYYDPYSCYTSAY